MEKKTYIDIQQFEIFFFSVFFSKIQRSHLNGKEKSIVFLHVTENFLCVFFSKKSTFAYKNSKSYNPVKNNIKTYNINQYGRKIWKNVVG